MAALIKKTSWQSCIALCLLLGCGQTDTIINPEIVITPQQGTITQEGESFHLSLHQAVLEGNIEMVRALLPTVYVNTPDDQGNTLLHLAVSQDDLELVKILIEAKADIHAKNIAGITPLQLADQKGNTQIIAALAAVGRNPMSLVQLLFYWDYENIGKKRILEYIPMKDKGHLRGTCVEMGWMLLQKDALNVSLTADRLQHIRLQDYPRLYPHIQHANGITFQPVPGAAVVQQVGDLQRIVGDTRFAIKSVVFKGGLEGLKGVCKALPQTIHEFEIGVEIPADKGFDLSSYQQLKVVKVKNNQGNLRLPGGAIVLYVSHDAKQPFIKVTTPEVISLLSALRDEDARKNATDELIKIGTPEVISGLLMALKDQDSGVRSSAALALNYLEVNTPEVIIGLLAALQDKDWLVRSNAAYALGNLKASTPDVIRGLLVSLQDKEVRRSAADALVEIGTPEVISGLLACLKNEDKFVRSIAASALGKLKASIPEVISGLLAALQDRVYLGENSAADALVKIGTPEVISGLLASLQHEDSYIRYSAADALIKIGTPEAISGLLASLQDKESHVRSSAVYVLGNLKVSTPEVIRGLLTALQDQDKDVRSSAASALGNLKASTPEVISGLLVSLQDQDKDVRSSAASALGELKASTPEVISVLLAFSQDKDEDSHVRSSAADALVKIGTSEVISGLLMALQDKGSDVRWRAAEMLKEIKASTPEAISGWLTALQDEDLNVRWRAAEALGGSKASTPEVIRGLLTALQDWNSDVRSSAASALGSIKASTPEVISGLLTALQDREKDVRSSAAGALEEIKASIPEVISLLSALRGEDYHVRNSVAEALVKIGTPEVISGLLTALQDCHSDVSSSAADALGKLKASTPEVIRGLLTALQDQGSVVSSSAAKALGKLKASTPDVISGLLASLQNWNSSVRSSAASALGDLKASTPEVISGLLTALQDKDEYSDVRSRAIEALVKIGTPEVIRGLLASLQDKDSDVRSSAVSVLVKIGTPDVIRGLLASLQDWNSDVRSSAASALGSIKASTPEVISGLLTALQDKDSSVRRGEATALGKLKASTPDIISGLLTALQDQDQDWQARSSAADALVKIGTPEVIRGLLASLQDKDYSVRSSAADALVKIGTPEVISVLLASLQDEYRGARSSAASALGFLKASTPEIISGLLASLQDKDSSVRSSAASALGFLKASTPEVISGLLASLQDKDYSARSSAVDALVNLKASTPEVISGLLASLQVKDKYARKRAASALGELKASTPGVISGLLASLQDKESDVRRSAASALGELKASTPEVISGLLASLQDKDSSVRWSAASALGFLKASTPDIISGLLASLQDKESFTSLYVRRSAAEALVNLKASTPEVISGLLASLQDKESDVRRSAADALRELKVSTPEVISGLLTALQHEDSYVRRRAVDALGEVGMTHLKADVQAGLFSTFQNKQENAAIRNSAADALDKMRAHLLPEQVQALGDYYYDRLDYEKAAGQYSKLLELTGDKKGSETYAVVVARVIEAYLKSEKQENLYKVQDYFAQAETAFNKLERKQLLSEQTNLLFTDLLTNIGSFYFKTLNYPTAEKYFNLALKKLEIAGKYQEKLEYLNLLHKQGLLALAKGNTSQAIQKFESAQNCYKNIENPDKDFRRAYVGIGEGMIRSYIELNKLDEAYKLCIQVIKMIGQLGGESLASFDSSIKRMIDVMQLQLEAAESQKKKELIGSQLKQLLYNHEEGRKVPELKEVLDRLDKFKPEIIQALIDCYSEINVEEMDHWIKEGNKLKEKRETTQLAAKEKYYIQTTLLNAISTNKTVQNGTIEVNISSRGRQALSKELWESLNESERKEIKHNPKVENLDLESLTTKPQEAIRDLLQANITEAVQYVYTCAKERKIEDIRPLIETVACTLSKGIIKTKSDKVEEQAAYLMRKKDSKNYPYSKAEKLEEIFLDFCNELNNRIYNLPKEGQDRVEWAKRTCAWIEYRINLTDNFYGEDSSKVAALLTTYVCALADTKMPVFLNSEDYSKGSPNTIREENSREDQASLQFAEWEHYYVNRFPGEEPNFGMWMQRLEQLSDSIKGWLNAHIIASEYKKLLEQLPAALLEQMKCLSEKENLMQRSELTGNELSLYRGARSELTKEIEELCQDVRMVLEILSKKKAVKSQDSILLSVNSHEVSQGPINDRLLKTIEELPKKIGNLSTPEAPKPVDYYVAEANQNMGRISKLVGTGTLSTTSYASKGAAIKAYDHDLLSSKVEADFTQEIKRLYNGKDRPFNSDKELETFVKETAYNLLKSNIKIDEKRKDIDIFREEEKGTEKWRIWADFSEFVRELRGLLLKLEAGQLSAKYVGALIHYRVAMTGRFFKDGNRRIALALETFVMMRNNHELPGFYNETDWKIAAPTTFKNEESLEYVKDLTEDARFLKWYYKYDNLFGTKQEWSPLVEKIEPKDSWRVMAQGALTRALEQRHTIYAEDNIFQIPGVLRSYVEKTGIEVKKLVVFKPERTLLHEAIAAVVSQVSLPADDEEGKALGNIVNQVYTRVENKDTFRTFAQEMKQRCKSFKEIIARKLQRNVHVGTKDDPYAKLINKYTELLGHHYERAKKRMRVEDEKKALTKLIAWELLKREYQVDIEDMVSQEMLALEKEKEKHELIFLTTKTGYERAIWVLAGGPASGKTSIFNAKVKQHLCTKNNIDACNINPDIFKPLLLKLGEDYHAARTHEESSHIKDLILNKLEYMLDKTEKAPSMILDVVNPDLKKFAAILKDNPKINLYTTTCPVTDKGDIKGSITRAFLRASEPLNYKGEKNPDYGRYVPSYIVLDGHKKVSGSFPGFIKSGRYSLIELYDNTTRASRQVCHLEGKALRIDDFSSFIEFLKKRHINTKAYSEETVYGKKFVDRDTKALKPEHMASSLAEYLKSGIIINYQQHTHWDKGLLSTNLSQSLNDFAADLVKDIAENKESSKEESSKEEARILFEALILDILNRANLKEAFPISLKEGQEKAISIFSNEIEKEGYLLKGSVFRFLRAINNIILKEKGTKLSDSALDKISRDVLKMVIAKELPREEEKLIKYLPQVIESALYAATKKT
jgi:HEAT repeat protein